MFTGTGRTEVPFTEHTHRMAQPGRLLAVARGQKAVRQRVRCVSSLGRIGSEWVGGSSRDLEVGWRLVGVWPSHTAAELERPFDLGTSPKLATPAWEIAANLIITI